jgi:multisubunit Na+/H+ antiporter MnhG subunit
VTRTVLAAVFVYGAVALVLVSCVGLLVMREASQRLHYVTPVALVAPVLLGLGVLAQSGWSENSALTWLALLFVAGTGPFLAHATIRAVRIRETGDWRLRPPPHREPGRDSGGGPW